MKKTWSMTGCSGPVAYSIADHKLGASREDIDAWRQVTIATDFD